MISFSNHLIRGETAVEPPRETQPGLSFYCSPQAYEFYAPICLERLRTLLQRAEGTDATGVAWRGRCMYVCMYVWSSHIAEYGSTG